MATDRFACLLAQAAVRGLLNLEHADYDDPKWWRHFRLLLDGLEQDNRLRWAEHVHRHNTAVAQIPGVTKESFEEASKSADANLRSIQRKLFPWEQHDEPTRDVDAWREAYIKRFGDWRTDPTAKANLDALVAHLEKRAKEGAEMLAKKQGLARSAAR